MTPVNLRPELGRHLSSRLQAFREGFRHNLALIGPPGSGKTFQLHQLLAHHEPDTMLIYCPLYRESCRSFLQRFLYAILEAGLRTVTPAEMPNRVEPLTPLPLDRLLQSAEAHAPRTIAAARAIDGLLTRRLYGEAFNRTLDTIPLLLEERRTPCVLMLDEFLYLEELGLGHAFHELGKRVMTWPSTLFVLTSSAPHRARVILRERLQLLFGQFELLTLEALDPTAAALWVQQELRGLRHIKTVSPFLLNWLGSYPWYLAVILKRLKELATLSKRPDDTSHLFLQTAWDALGSTEGTLHQWCASRIERLMEGRVGARAAEALIQICQGARTTTDIGRRIGRAGLTQALQVLVEHDLAQRNGTCWIVTDPILQCWASTALIAQRSDARLDGREIRQRFDAYLSSLWSDWVRAHQLSFPEQVVGLFAKFNDETVLLDSKTGRLPKFRTITTSPARGTAGESYVVAEGLGKRWCATIQERHVDESTIASFEAFCRTQRPKPSRKVVVAKAGVESNARLLAKTANMWVWEADALALLTGLYASPRAS